MSATTPTPQRPRTRKQSPHALDQSHSKHHPGPTPNTNTPEPLTLSQAISQIELSRYTHSPPPPLDPLRQRDAPPPPPGYRYTLDGRLAPFYESNLPITDRNAQAIFCEVLELSGSFRTACDSLGIANKRVVENEILLDLEFAAAAEAAADRHRQRLYAHAVHRATVGFQVPIIGGPMKNEIVGYETKVSDTLLVLLLKRHFVEFRETKASAVTINNNQLNVANMPDMTKVPKERRDEMRRLLGNNVPKVIDATAIHIEPDGTVQGEQLPLPLGEEAIKQ